MYFFYCFLISTIVLKSVFTKELKLNGFIELIDNSKQKIVKYLRNDAQKSTESVEFKNMLEEKYKFDNDELSRRFKITSHKREYPELIDNSKQKIVKYLRNDAQKSTESVEFKNMLEEKYKFDNDELSRRFKITSHKREYPDDILDSSDENLAWFRTYAARRIVGGMETDIYTYPYNVAIERSGRHWCGGSLIDEQWVLSAGHCFESVYDEDKIKLLAFVLRAGSSFHNRGGYQARANKVFFPSGYSPGNADYDLSLVRLDRPMPIGRNIAVLNLPAQGFRAQENDVIVVTGWGSTDKTGFGHVPERLRFVPVPVMNLQQCQKYYQFYITPRMLCAGYETGGRDACNHDSGGPAVRNGVLLGVVSFGGKICGDPKSPGVYSRVSEMTSWVERTITSNEAATVPELKAKIKKARMREYELERIKMNLEDKKRTIKEWLRDAFNSPTFIRIAKKKLAEVGFNIRRSRNMADFRRRNRNLTIDDATMDQDNLNNLIEEKIIDPHSKTLSEAEKVLHVLALHEVMSTDEMYAMRESDRDGEDVERLVAYLLRH